MRLKEIGRSIQIQEFVNKSFIGTPTTMLNEIKENVLTMRENMEISAAKLKI